MNDTTSREIVLSKIRNALRSSDPLDLDRIDWDENVYHELSDSKDLVFAREFTKVSGKFVFCQSELEFVKSLIALMKKEKWGKITVNDPLLREMLDLYEIPHSEIDLAQESPVAGLTRCEFLIARLGSVMVSSAQASGRKLNVFPDVHLVMAYSSQLVSDLKEGLKKLKQKYKNDLPSMVSVITGPSRTADIEKTLVMGAHGPKDLYVFLIEDI